jgi:hypothetical protein
MTAFEKLATIAAGEGEVFDMARAAIGHAELALLLAKNALDGTTETLSPTRVSKIFEMSESGARKKIENAAVKEPVK